MTADEGEYALVMPFVACESQGGPYDDTAFVAAYNCATVAETLRTLAHLHTNGLTAATVERYVRPDLIPQLDLIAMKHGFTLTHEPWDEHPDDYTRAVFTLAEVAADG